MHFKTISSKTIFKNSDYRDECIEECNRLGGNLTSIHTEEENVFLASLLKPNSKTLATFIGADEVTSKNFVWRDGTDWDYENWYSGGKNIQKDQGRKFKWTIFQAGKIRVLIIYHQYFKSYLFSQYQNQNQILTNEYIHLFELLV